MQPRLSQQAVGQLGHHLQALLPESRLADARDIAALPATGGAYALIIAIDQPLAIHIGRRRLDVAPGLYVYAGSAYGPGGLRARLLRHARRDKRRHWHIDQLTDAASHLAALAITGGNECAIITRLTEVGGFHHPWPGFGSSDCRCCPSHLLRQAP